MPTYQYACTECQQQLEAVQSFSDPALTECPNCQGKLRKVFNSVGIVFKGTGFYRNDSRAGAVGADKAASGDGAKSGESSSSSSDSSASSAPASSSAPAKSGESSSGSAGGSSSGGSSGGSSSGSSGNGSSSGTKAAAAS